MNCKQCPWSVCDCETANYEELYSAREDRSGVVAEKEFRRT